MWWGAGHFVFFPIYRARAVDKPDISSAHTQLPQLPASVTSHILKANTFVLNMLIIQEDSFSAKEIHISVII